MNMRRFVLSLLMSATVLTVVGQVNRLALPLVLYGYRSLNRPWLPDTIILPDVASWRTAQDSLRRAEAVPETLTEQISEALTDSIDIEDLIPSYQAPYDYENPIGPALPQWLAEVIRMRDFEDNLMFRIMMENPEYIDYAEWYLPTPPPLPGQDNSRMGIVRNLNMPQQNMQNSENVVDALGRRINWLHTLNISLQLSQAYISDNWYQGGSDYLAFFGNFLWDVNLNEFLHPKLIYQSTLNYKLAINSTSQDKYHKYAISQELFQYNTKFGYKARHNWYYSVTAQFKTQFLNSYGQDSEVRKASFLSPATLNVGAGMTYNLEKKQKRLKLSISIAPISYNLKICTDDLVDHAQFNMLPGQRTVNEYGSNTEINFYWAFRNNISYSTRLFLFTDYSHFNGDWENTLNFQWTKLFSTQIYAYLRYDSAADVNLAPKWKKWMLKEILSVGLSYNFSTKTK